MSPRPSAQAGIGPSAQFSVFHSETKQGNIRTETDIISLGFSSQVAPGKKKWGVALDAHADVASVKVAVGADVPGVRGEAYAVGAYGLRYTNSKILSPSLLKLEAARGVGPYFGGGVSVEPQLFSTSGGQ